MEYFCRPAEAEALMPGSAFPGGDGRNLGRAARRGLGLPRRPSSWIRGTRSDRRQRHQQTSSPASRGGKIKWKIMTSEIFELFVWHKHDVLKLNEANKEERLARKNLEKNNKMEFFSPTSWQRSATRRGRRARRREWCWRTRTSWLMLPALTTSRTATSTWPTRWWVSSHWLTCSSESSSWPATKLGLKLASTGNKNE